MKYFISLATTLLLLGLSVAAFSTPFTKEQKAAEITFLANLIQNQYGPLEYKATTMRIHLRDLVDQYIKEAEKSSDEEYLYLLNRFIAEFKDSHFGTRVNTTHVSKLGFVTDRVQGKVVIDTIDRELLPEKAFPFERGDEVVSVDGVPADTLVQDLARYVPAGNPETALRNAAVLVAYRASSVAPPQTGEVTVVIKRRGSNITASVPLKWLDEGEAFDMMKARRAANRTVGMTDFLNLRVDAMDFLPKTEKDHRCMPTTRFTIPKDATVITKTPFVAYYHPTPKGNVGYLRIPHYYWRNPVTNANENDLRLANYEYVVNELQKNTNALVIDQTHNCGGSISMVEQMAALFIERAYPGLEFQLLASRSEYLDFKKAFTGDHLLTMAAVDHESVLKKMREANARGERLTAKTTFRGASLVQPRTVQYTKPLLVLIDEMSGSGGDAFPGLLQGYNRAKLMGTRTMGAGGHVIELPNLPLSGNTLRMTKSLFFHGNGKFIENLGVSPDVVYEPTIEDYVDSYKPYQQEYLKQIQLMMP